MIMIILCNIFLVLRASQPEDTPKGKKRVAWLLDECNNVIFLEEICSSLRNAFPNPNIGMRNACMCLIEQLMFHLHAVCIQLPEILSFHRRVCCLRQESASIKK